MAKTNAVNRSIKFNSNKQVFITTPQTKAKATTSSIQTLADTGATDTLIRLSDVPNDLKLEEPKNLIVELPNHATIQPIASASFSISPTGPHIDAHIFRDGDLSQSLTAIAPLCAQDCSATFTDTTIRICDNTGLTKLLGHRDPQSNLWSLPLPVHPTSTPTLLDRAASMPRSEVRHAHLAMRHELDADYVAFTHACLGYPAVSTLINAVKQNWLSTFPRITAKMIAANPPNQLATAQGHLDRTRRGMQSTKQPAVPEPRNLPTHDTSTADIDTERRHF